MLWWGLAFFLQTPHASLVTKWPQLDRYSHTLPIQWYHKQVIHHKSPTSRWCFHQQTHIVLSTRNYLWCHVCFKRVLVHTEWSLMCSRKSHQLHFRLHPHVVKVGTHERFEVWFLSPTMTIHLRLEQSLWCQLRQQCMPPKKCKQYKTGQNSLLQVFFSNALAWQGTRRQQICCFVVVVSFHEKKEVWFLSHLLCATN